MTEYKDIERNRDGFVTDDALEQMYLSLPILVFSIIEGLYPTIEYIDKNNWQDSVGDIERDPKWKYWKATAPLPEIES